MKSNVKLGVIGCGKMASAILTGVFKNKFLNPENIFLYDVDLNASKLLSEKFGFKIVDSIENIVDISDVILLAVKPFKIDDVMNVIKKNYKNNLILSILAGVKLKKYMSYIDNIKVIRIMPNTPALVNEGMSSVCASDDIDSGDVEFALNFMGNCGKVIKISEEKIDIITALSGSGPAFYFKIIEEFAKCASKLGLNFDEAMLLASQTALGSAKMLIENNFDAETLIKNVTTPGGCTAVGNDVLNSSNISNILYDTLSKTAKKASELG